MRARARNLCEPLLATCFTLTAPVKESSAEKRARLALEKVQQQETDRRTASAMKTAEKILEKIGPVIASIDGLLGENTESVAPALIAGITECRDDLNGLKARALEVKGGKKIEVLDLKEPCRCVCHAGLTDASWSSHRTMQ